MRAIAPVLPGETLAGKYRVERIIGEGGMGIVVAARHLALDERIAIKFLIGEPTASALERFLREARATAKIKGEHVCRVFDFGRLETGEPYIVMEHLEGIDLARKLATEGPQDPVLVVGWIIEACAALAEAHALGIVHRDLKPANLFIAQRPDGSTCTKVLDFGISKLPSQEKLTRTEATMGSPAYMSPEQLDSSRDVDARADVWSLGVVLYELLSGAPPFRAASMLELALTIREKAPPSIGGIAPELARIVEKCLSKQPADRYAGVIALATALAPLAPPDVAGLVARLERNKAAASPGPSNNVKGRGQSNAEASSAEGAAAASPPRASVRSGDQETDDDDVTPPPPSPLAGSVAVDSSPVARPEVRSTRGDAALEDARVTRTRGTFAPLQSTMDVIPGARRGRKQASALAAGAGLLVIAFLTRRAILGGDEPRHGPHGIAIPSSSTPEPISTAEPTPSLHPAPPERSSSPSITTGPAVSASATRPMPPTRPPRLPTPMTVTASVIDEPPIASATVTATASAPPSEPPRHRRKLDREDPL